MSTIITRKAILNDLPVLAEFLQLLVDAERPFDETLKEGDLIYYDLQDLIQRDDSEVLVLEDNGKLVGAGYAQIRKAKPYQIEPEYAHLGFQYVLPEYRGRGLNQQLIEGLKSWIRTKGVREVRLDVYTYNNAAVRAYEKAGFKQILTTMRCDIG
ncbi:GNAT family N-acetyltransferase [Pseudoflavitalea sp. G-6-1-2]|uniref:GNAT family N-acetyltransferase n=1 Tax=Pseudoflavitalea sp. G-6-1-2 TaxID=2728841 RepID=UPI00146D2136|nr:GNAT family N-acetyltransferase [Pseudoflavitalea sp. G-6-1-2]NML21875.1 GNAT family N-acetyltransferase [Pseudoflavitalea sp. G-6-1-2]